MHPKSTPCPVPPAPHVIPPPSAHYKRATRRTELPFYDDPWVAVSRKRAVPRRNLWNGLSPVPPPAAAPTVLSSTISAPHRRRSPAGPRRAADGRTSTWALWPYDAAQVCWANPPVLDGAVRYAFTDIGYVYQRPRAVAQQAIRAAGVQDRMPGLPLSVAIRQQLFARRRPVSVSVPVVWSAWPWTGVVTMPSPTALAGFAATQAPPNVEGWHCIAVCGWDNASGRFLFKNSWGPGGESGYGTIPYQYIEAYSDVAMTGW